MSNRTNEQAVDRPSVEELFQRLPPLGSEKYLQHVRSASTEELPAEVLARAFRQLPPDTPAARATLERLFGRIGSRWEYLAPLAARARREAKRRESRNPGDEHRDLLQDAITRIWSVLPTTRGELAERAWNVFCHHAFVDAWRERYGRRGEKLRGVREASTSSTDGEDYDPLDRLTNEASPWPAVCAHYQSERIEAIVTSVVNSLTDPFEQAVARAAWRSGQRPKTSGATAARRDPPLTAQFPDKSRHQINRVLREVDSRLAGALLAEPNLDWSDDLLAFLRVQAERGNR